MGEAMLQRAGLLGDIHQEDEALDRALAIFVACGVDRVLAVGDIADGQGDLARSLRLLREGSVEVVRGNHDRWLLRDSMRDLPHAARLADLADGDHVDLMTMPVTRDYDSPAGRVLLCHGLGRHDMEAVTPDCEGYALQQNGALQELLASRRYRVVLSGHTHRAMVRAIEGVTFVNAGALHRDHDPCCLVVDFVERWVDRYPLDACSIVEPIRTPW